MWEDTDSDTDLVDMEKVWEDVSQFRSKFRHNHNQIWIVTTLKKPSCSICSCIIIQNAVVTYYCHCCYGSNCAIVQTLQPLAALYNSSPLSPPFVNVLGEKSCHNECSVSSVRQDVMAAHSIQALACTRLYDPITQTTKKSRYCTSSSQKKNVGFK